MTLAVISVFDGFFVIMSLKDRSVFVCFLVCLYCCVDVIVMSLNDRSRMHVCTAA